MPNLDGLSDEERKRAQALSDKVRGDFTRAQSGQQPKAKDAPAPEQRRADATMARVLTPDGQTRMQQTPQGQRREQEAQKMADRVNMDAMQKSDAAQQRANARKAFNRARSRNRMREREDFER